MTKKDEILKFFEDINNAYNNCMMLHNLESFLDELVEESKNKITVNKFLNLIDNNRESEEFVEIMNHNGEVEMRAMVCSTVWSGLEQRTVNSIQAQDDVIQMWLDD